MSRRPLEEDADGGRTMGHKLAAWSLRVFGGLLFIAALLFGASKAPDRSLESLVPQWAPPPSDFIELRGQPIHIRDQGPAGDSVPVLLLHGTSSSLHTWEGWVKTLATQRRVISVDLPGFGLSGPSPSADYRDEAYLDFMAALLDHLKLERVILGGNSLGGQIAWQYAVRAPERVQALILVDAAGYPFAPQDVPLAWQASRLPLIGPLSEHVLPRKLVEYSVRQVYGNPDLVNTALVDRYFELTLRAGNRTALRQRLAQWRGGEQAAKIQSLRQPTLILWGERDRLLPPSDAQAFARDIAGSRLVMLPGLGHVPQEEDPAASLKPVLEFLHTLKP